MCARGIQDSCICICIESNTGASQPPQQGDDMLGSTLRIVTPYYVGKLVELFQPLHSRKKLSPIKIDYAKTVQGNTLTLRPNPKNTRHSSYTVILGVSMSIVGNPAWSYFRIEIALFHMREQTYILIIYKTINNLIVCLFTHMIWAIGNLYNCS